MTVVDVWAEINGHPTKLTNTNGNIWSVTAPSDCPDGSYTCAFWAIDTAGNIGYKTAILWVFDGRLTCIRWVEDKISVKYLVHDFVSSIKDFDYLSMIKESLYSAHTLPNMYSCHYIKQRCPND